MDYLELSEADKRARAHSAPYTRIGLGRSVDFWTIPGVWGFWTPAPARGRGWFTPRDETARQFYTDSLMKYPMEGRQQGAIIVAFREVRNVR